MRLRLPAGPTRPSLCMATPSVGALTTVVLGLGFSPGGVDGRARASGADGSAERGGGGARLGRRGGAPGGDGVRVLAEFALRLLPGLDRALALELVLQRRLGVDATSRRHRSSVSRKDARSVHRRDRDGAARGGAERARASDECAERASRHRHRARGCGPAEGRPRAPTPPPSSSARGLLLYLGVGRSMTHPSARRHFRCFSEVYSQNTTSWTRPSITNVRYWWYLARASHPSALPRAARTTRPVASVFSLLSSSLRSSQ